MMTKKVEKSLVLWCLFGLVAISRNKLGKKIDWYNNRQAADTFQTQIPVCVPFLCRQPLLLFVYQSALLALCLCMWQKLPYILSNVCVWRVSPHTSLSKSGHVQVYSSPFVPQSLNRFLARVASQRRVPASFLLLFVTLSSFHAP